LFVAPILVFVSLLLGHPLTLVFHQFELLADRRSLIAALVSADSESTGWKEQNIGDLYYFRTGVFLLPA
jgi:Ca2+:H+ antiporter